MNINLSIFSKAQLFIFFIFSTNCFSQTNANTWTWIKGSNGVDQHGIYGSIGVSNPNNNPGGRHSHGSWGSLSGKLYVMGGVGYDINGTNSELLNDLWQFDTSTNNWTWLKGSANSKQFGIYGTQGIANVNNTPGARELFTTWTQNNILYLMGGFGKDINGDFGDMNDLWKFDTNTKLWTWLRGANIGEQPAVYGNQGAGSTLNEPGSRLNASSWTTNLLYLFGGQGKINNGDNGNLNDLWKYDPITNNWTWIKGSNMIDQPGIYGTQGVANPSNTPGSRDAAETWEYNGKLYLFGGYGFDADGNEGLLNDLWKYDPVTENWTWLKGSKLRNSPNIFGTKGIELSTNNPMGRNNPSTWVFGDKFYLFGGGSGDDGETTDDLWQYDTQTNNWTWLKGSKEYNQFPVYGTQGVPSQTNTPGFRASPIGAYLYNFKLYLMGGNGGGSVNEYGLKNDIWEYKPCTQMATVAAGNWNDPNVWSCGKVPNGNDAVFIGHNITLNSAISCKNITYTAGGGITFSAGANLMLAMP